MSVFLKKLSIIIKYSEKRKAIFLNKFLSYSSEKNLKTDI